MNAGALKHLQATKTSWHQKKEKNGQNSSQRKSNLEFLLLLSDAPEGPRPCQSINLNYFHHPPIIPKIFPFSFLVVLKYYRKALFLL